MKYIDSQSSQALQSSCNHDFCRCGSFLVHFFLLLPLFTSLIVFKGIGNGIVPNNIFLIFGGIGFVCIASLIYLLLFRRSFHFSITDVFAILFVGGVFVSAFVINDATVNTTKIVVLTLLLVLYLCVRLITYNNQQIINYLCLFIILTGLIEAIWGMMQLYGFLESHHNLFKLTGSFFNPGPYSGYLAVVFPLSLFASISCADNSWVFTKMKRIVAVATCITILLVLPAGMSRASWLAFIVGSVVVLVGARRRELFFGLTKRSQDNTPQRGELSNKAMAKIFAVALGICLIIASLVGLYYLKKDSADGRLLMWKMATSAMIQHPLGVGLGHFPDAYGEAQAAYFASGNASEVEAFVAGNPEYGFNEFLQIGVESGIASLLLFIGMIICAYQGLIKSKNWGVMGALTSLLVFACFSYPFSVLPFLIVFVFLLAFAGDTQIKQINTDKKSVIIRSISVICVQVCCVIVTTFCLWKQCPVYDVYKQWKSKQMYYQMGMYQEVAQSYESLYPYLNDQVNFLFEYGRSLSQSEQPEKSNEVLQHAT